MLVTKIKFCNNIFKIFFRIASSKHLFTIFSNNNSGLSDKPICFFCVSLNFIVLSLNTFLFPFMTDRFPLFWDTADVLSWLRSVGLQDFSSSFLRNEIDGYALFELTKQDLMLLSTQCTSRLKLKREIRILRSGLENQIKTWTEDEVINWFLEHDYDHFIEDVISHSINGEKFLSLSVALLTEYCVTSFDLGNILYLKNLARGRTKPLWKKIAMQKLVRIESNSNSPTPNSSFKFAPFSHSDNPERISENSFPSKSCSSSSLTSSSIPSSLYGVKTPSSIFSHQSNHQENHQWTSNRLAIKVRIVNRENYLVKHFHMNETFEAMQRWVISSFGRAYQIHYRINGKVFPILSNKDLVSFFELAKKYPVSILLEP
jgi:hypothetical protein